MRTEVFNRSIGSGLGTAVACGPLQDSVSRSALRHQFVPGAQIRYGYVVPQPRREDGPGRNLGAPGGYLGFAAATIRSLNLSVAF